MLDERLVNGSNNMPSEIGREENQELAKESSDFENTSEIENTSETGHEFLKRKILDLDDVNSIDEIEKLQNNENANIDNIKMDNYKKLDEGMLWHYRLGHPSYEYLKHLQKTIKEIEKVKFDISIRDCEICILSKMEKVPFKNERIRAINALQIVHADIMGPIKPT